MNEFELIKNFCSHQTVHRTDVIIETGDDCAIVEVPVNQQLAITTDTLVAGVHFPLNTSAYDIGYKALAVNLSDLAAMGATPAWITMALTLPEIQENWLTDFAHGFFALATRSNVQLIGGDLTHGPLTITIQAQGFIPKGQAITRSGAKVGDLIYVTHTLGDAGLALAVLQNQIKIPTLYEEDILKRLNRPEPRLEVGEKLRQIANAAIDISDGLTGDLNHILKKSEVGAVIYVDELPLSEALRTCLPEEKAILLALGAGDDYELCFTIPKEREKLLQDAMKDCPCAYSCIGEVIATPGLSLQFKDGRKYHGDIKGYQHF
ncbi:MAG: thiamine-phosphate kinase [Gammaproteobacteria bacterium]|nr:thiamine-phosphate kinase [Gammaproteobacteria bacterium]